MASFPFNTLRSTILQRASKLEVCQTYHEAQMTSNYLELLQVGCGLYAYAYQCDIIDDTLIEEFTDADLNTFGVYKTNVTLNNPIRSQYKGCHGYTLTVEEAPSEGQDLFFVKSSSFTINMSLNNKLTVWAMGQAIGHINMVQNSKLNLYMYNTASVTVSLTDNCILCMETNNGVFASVTGNIVSVVTGSLRHKSNVTYTGNGTSSGIFKLYAKSNLNPTVAGTASIDIQRYNRSTINSLEA